MVALKVCGITNLEDARQIAKLNCRMLGLIFADASPRCIDRSTAQKISLLVFQNYNALPIFFPKDCPFKMKTTMSISKS